MYDTQIAKVAIANSIIVSTVGGASANWYLVNVSNQHGQLNENNVIKITYTDNAGIRRVDELLDTGGEPVSSRHSSTATSRAFIKYKPRGSNEYVTREVGLDASGGRVYAFNGGKTEPVSWMSRHSNGILGVNATVFDLTCRIPIHAATFYLDIPAGEIRLDTIGPLASYQTVEIGINGPPFDKSPFSKEKIRRRQFFVIKQTRRAGGGLTATVKINEPITIE